jgi:type IV secretory pathway VirD2 relaxase
MCCIFNWLYCQHFTRLSGSPLGNWQISLQIEYGSHLQPQNQMSEDDFRVRPGKVRDRGRVSTKRAQTLIGQIKALQKRGGNSGPSQRGQTARSTNKSGRGRAIAFRLSGKTLNRRVTVKARIIQHRSLKYSAAPLARHLAYLQRDGVSRDGRDADLFDARTDTANGDAFAERCADDRHHFRFIVSPEDCSELSDVRAFMRDLVATMERDLGSKLEWVGVDHWNTDNPHVHLLIRGKADNGRDLVIDKDYIRTGMRARAAELVTAELGHRSERDIDLSLKREVEAERWTSLDRRLQSISDGNAGLIDLRPEAHDDRSSFDKHLAGRAIKLERLGLADRIAPGCWTLKPGMEKTLRDLSLRGDIIKTMHRAMTVCGREVDPGRFAMHIEAPTDPVIGRLVERGLHDELTGQAYAIVDGADGRVHHLKFGDLEWTGDAAPGAIVELGSWESNDGKTRTSLVCRSDLPLDRQITANGATWIDRQLLSSDATHANSGFGAEIQRAKIARAEFLEQEGLARRQGNRFILARNLLDTLRERELAGAAEAISARTGLPRHSTQEGDAVSGIYRERVTLASGRFAMIDDGMGFVLVPWRPALDKHLGEHVMGGVKPGGGIDWTIGRSRGLGI